MANGKGANNGGAVMLHGADQRAMDAFKANAKARQQFPEDHRVVEDLAGVGELRRTFNVCTDEEIAFMRAAIKELMRLKKAADLAEEELEPQATIQNLFKEWNVRRTLDELIAEKRIHQAGAITFPLREDFWISSFLRAVILAGPTFMPKYSEKPFDIPEFQFIFIGQAKSAAKESSDSAAT